MVAPVFRHGTGKFSSQGCKYEGHWEDDKQHGQGFSLLDNKDRYVGEQQGRDVYISC